MDKKKMIFLISMLLVVIIIFGILIYFTYLQKEKSNATITISLNELVEQIKNTDEFDYSKMQDVDTDFASSTFLIDKDKMQEIIGKIPLVNTKASMFVIIKTNNENLQDTKLALESYAAEYETQWANYLPDQYELVKERKIGILGNYVYMIVSESPDKIIKLIK